jgi:hypothetical protein
VRHQRYKRYRQHGTALWGHMEESDTAQNSQCMFLGHAVHNLSNTQPVKASYYASCIMSVNSNLLFYYSYIAKLANCINKQQKMLVGDREACVQRHKPRPRVSFTFNNAIVQKLQAAGTSYISCGGVMLQQLQHPTPTDVCAQSDRCCGRAMYNRYQETDRKRTNTAHRDRQRGSSLPARRWGRGAGAPAGRPQHAATRNCK